MPSSSAKRPSLEAQLQSLATSHKKGLSGVRVALEITATLDTLLASIYKSSRLSNLKGIAVVALGGYGRKELNFGSDIDIMVLPADEGTRTESVRAINDFLHRLLDQGLDLGHSVRTIDECLQARGDLEVWISLLEARYVAGSVSTFRQLRKRIDQKTTTSSGKGLAQELLTVLQQRHEKYGHSSKLLEPNIKNSAGGLRDLHTVLWLLLGTRALRLPAPLPKGRTAVTAMLRSPKAYSIFHHELLRESLRAFDVLLRVRNEMHLQSKGLHDTLEFSFQRPVAEGLMYGSSATSTSVERFMRDYYIAARSISQLTRRTVSWAKEDFVKIPQKEGRMIDSSFAIRHGALEFRKRVRSLTNDQILTSFTMSVEHGIPFSHNLEDQIGRAVKNLPPLKFEKETALFRLLLSGHTVGAILQQMNDLGLLSRWIPEWKPLVAFFQHNIYHYYTADEHTLRVLANAESLQTSGTSFGEVFRSLLKKETLFLACLFHDIGKPKRIGDHEIVGVKMTKKALKRLGYTDISDDVLFLVRHHLAMEQVAFRRNLNDPLAILDFASLFRTPEQLDYLYVLTYADLSAVNKNVWTDWKEALLFDLYRKTKEVLTNKLTEEELRARERTRLRESLHSLAQTLSPTITVEEALSHLDAIESHDYLLAFSKAEIADHIEHIRQNALVSALFKHQRDHSEITVIARDAPFVLARFCGVLTANDVNILDANIFTRTDGIIIDKFRVTDFISRSRLTEDQCSKIRLELLDVFRGATQTEELLYRHRMKWKRRAQMQNPNTRIDVEFEDHPRFCIIDIYAADTLGFLYRITKRISELGLSITFAKIATRVDGIVDTFYVLDRANGSLPSEEQRKKIRRELLSLIRELSTSQLTIGHSSS